MTEKNIVAIIGLVSAIISIFVFVTGVSSIKDILPEKKELIQAEIGITVDGSESVEKSDSDNDDISKEALVPLNNIEYSISDIKLYKNIEDAKKRINSVERFDLNDKIIVVAFTINICGGYGEYAGHDINVELEKYKEGVLLDRKYVSTEKTGRFIFSFYPQTWGGECPIYNQELSEGFYRGFIKTVDSETREFGFWVVNQDIFACDEFGDERLFTPIYLKTKPKQTF